VTVGENSLSAGANGEKPSVLLSRTSTNQNTRNVLRSLVEQEMLAEFWTTFAWNSDSAWNRLLPLGLRAQLARRSYSEAPASRVKAVPWREVLRLCARGTLFENLLCSGERPFSVIGIGLDFDARVAQRLRELRPDLVYAYDGAALETFREARKLGITSVCELTSSYWPWARKLLAEEAEHNPDFANLLPSLADSPAYLECREEELRLADYVFVPSQHVLRTLAGVVPEEKIRVVPYGAPEVRPRTGFNLDFSRPLKVLFVGNLSQNKGISYLLDAMDMLGPRAELTLVGRKLSPNVRIDGACRRWKWFESLSNTQVLQLMQESDVFVLPSLSDGWGLVCTEALACGLPVIVTPNVGMSQIVRDTFDGFIVPIRRADAIADRLEVLYRDREKQAEMSRQAQATAAANTWQNYRTVWAQTLTDLEWQ